MALGDASTEQNFPFPTERVFPALVVLVPSLGFEITSADQVIGHVSATDSTINTGQWFTTVPVTSSPQFQPSS
jgi:hypothetical protein